MSSSYTNPDSVTIGDIRASLNDVESETLSDTTIEKAIEQAEVIATSVANPDASPRLVEIAITDVAVYRSMTGSDSGWAERKEALDAAVQYDVSSRISSLKQRADESLARISGENSPKLFSVGDRRDRPNRSRTGYSSHEAWY